MKSNRNLKKNGLVFSAILLGAIIIGTSQHQQVKATTITTNNLTDQIKFRVPNTGKQYYVYAWDDNSSTDGFTYNNTFTPIPKNSTNGIESLTLSMPSTVSSFHYFITDGTNWSTLNKFDADGNNGVTVSMKGKSETTFTSSAGYGITEPATSTSTAALQSSGMATVDEYQAAQENNFTSFDQNWAYQGTDLGATYTASATTFKVWAPTATSVQLISYGTNTSPTAPQVSATVMTRGNVISPTNQSKNTVGVWSVTLTGNKTGLVYQYKLTFADGTVSDYAIGTTGKPAYGSYSAASLANTTNDPYSVATTQGGLRSVVEAPTAIASNLSIKNGSAATWRVASPTQAIVDELHIREFTISPTSGVSAANKGKYLGVIQSGTTDPNTKTPTGLSYLKNEGFNYIQLMPTSQYASVNEAGTKTAAQPNNFNWGYDPENEMVPEGEYATNSVNPITRINEMKQMVQGLHNNGIGVIMDMVLNHVYSQSDSAFEKVEPGYYFRKYTQSGCGNDTASNHEMFGKFIVDSVTYWAKNYDIDGFRFDEMTLLDSNTMNKLRVALTAIDPKIMMYGEGWGDSNANNIAETGTAQFANVPGIGFFNAGIRDNIRGAGGTAFVDGNTSATVKVADGLLASGGWNGTATLEGFLSPSQSVNYVECHDSYSLNDQIWQNNPTDTLTTHRNRVELANSINILADGITFMETGQEYDQSKLVNPSNLTPLTSSQTQGYQNNPTTQPSWYKASWATAANSYNGLFGFDGMNYYGNYWPGSNLYTPIVAGDEVNAMDWDNISANQDSVNFISKLMKFKEANPQFWPNDYSKLAWTPTATGVEKITNASNGLITEELSSGTARYLVILNATGGDVTVGKSGSVYTTTDLTGTSVTLSSDSNLISGSTLGSSVTVQNLTATIIKLS